MWTHRWFSRPQLGGTHSECEVNQTSDLLLHLHGTFTLHKASEGDLIRPGFSVENSQKCDFTHTWQFDCDQIVILHTYPLTDSGNSIMMFAFTLTGLMFCCTLVLKYKSYLFFMTYLSCVIQNCGWGGRTYVWSCRSMSISVVSRDMFLVFRMI